MTWISDLHRQYEAAVAGDPFGARDSLRFWLHGNFVILGTFIALSARAGLLSWLCKVAFSCLTWLCFSLETSASYQQMGDESRVEDISYFEADAWEVSCRRLRYEPGERKPQATALARLLVFHLWQPATYAMIFYVYAPLLWSVSPLLGTISLLVLLREAIYAGFSVYTYAHHRAFMLYSLKHQQEPFFRLWYVISPDKMMIAAMGSRQEGWRMVYLGVTLLFLFLLDLAAALGLAIGLAAQVLDLPVMVLWSLTAAAPVLIVTGWILGGLGCDVRDFRSFNVGICLNALCRLIYLPSLQRDAND